MGDEEHQEENLEDEDIEEQQAGNQEPDQGKAGCKSDFYLFRKPDKYGIGGDFDLYVRRLNLYFEGVGLADPKRKRLALLFNLKEDAFRVAEPVKLEEDYERWIKELKLLFDKNVTPTERRFDLHQRKQCEGETVDAYAVALRELGAKCEFEGSEYNNRVIDQFIVGVQNSALQNKLLQEPPIDLDSALLIARRFEAARATQSLFRAERQTAVNATTTSSIKCYGCGAQGHIQRNCPSYSNGYKYRQNPSDKTCFVCNYPGHLAKDCSRNQPPTDRQCFSCGTFGHIARNCRRKQSWGGRNDNFYQRRQLGPREFLQGNMSDQQDQQTRNFSHGNRNSSNERADNNFSPNAPGNEAGRLRMSRACSNDKLTLVVEATLGQTPIACVVDTGSSLNLISREKWMSLKETVELVPSDIVAEAANGLPIAILGKTHLNLTIDTITYEYEEFYVAEKSPSDVLLGLSWIINSGVIIDARARQLQFPSGQTVSLRLDEEDSKSSASSKVCLIEDQEIPGRHEVILPARVQKSLRHNAIWSPQKR